MSMRVFAGLMLSLAMVVSCTEGSGKGVDDTDTDTDTETDIDTEPGDDTDGDTDTIDTPADTDETDRHTDTDLFDSDTDGLLDSGDSGSDSFGAGHTGVIPQPPDSGFDTGGGGGPGPGPGGGDTNVGCPALQVIDCEGVCANELLIGDGVCHDGIAFGQPNFDCELHDNDGGDCGSDTDDLPCGDPLEIRDCDGHCYPQTWIGDGSCDDGTTFPHGNPDFQCELFTWDGGDCPTDTELLP